MSATFGVSDAGTAEGGVVRDGMTSVGFLDEDDIRLLSGILYVTSEVSLFAF